MGDDGRLYVPKDMPLAYQDMMHLASVVTPNQFEAEQLVGFSLRTEQDAIQACNIIMDKGPHTVVCAAGCKSAV